MLIGVLLVAAACSDSKTTEGKLREGGTIVIATTSEPDILFPPLTGSVEGRTATELIYEYLADVGPDMNTIGDAGFVKELASSWRWSADSSSIAFDVNPKARWHDGAPVTARDVAFSFRTYTSETLASPAASSLADIDSVTVRSPLTAVFWFKKVTPHQFYDAAAQMLILPAHIFEGIPGDSLRERSAAMAPVGSGRFGLAAWTKGSSFELRAVDNHYRGRANQDRLIWTVSPEYNAAVTRAIGGEADVFANVRVESLEQLKKGGRFNVISLPGMDYAFMQLNLRKNVFASKDLRRAMTLALDRQSIVKNLFDTLAVVSIGPTVRAYPTTDTSIVQIPYDTARASRILDSLGWRRSARDGMRKKNGVSLQFTAIVPTSSMSRMRIAILIQEQLRQAGIEMRIDKMDWNAFQDRQSKSDFDVALASWHLPSNTEAVRGAWTTGGESNFGAYSNKVFDALVDSALNANTVTASKDYFRRANQLIVNDAPAIWLYEPRTLLAVNKRIQPTPMRPSAWWLDMASWKVSPE